MVHRARFRLMLVNAATMVAILAVLGLGIFLLGERLLLDQQTANLRARAADIRTDLANGDLRGLRQRDAGYDQGIFIVVWSRHAQVLFNPSRVNQTALLLPARAAIAGRSQVQTVELSRDQDALVNSEPVDAGQAAALQVGQSLQPMHDLERQAATLLLFAGAGAVLLSLGAGWILAGRALRPVAETLQQQRDFTADASHELRTPLAILDTGTQMLERHPEQPIGDQAELLNAMRAQTARMRRLIDELLELARGDAGLLTMRRISTDLLELMKTVADEMDPIARERGVSLTVSSAGDSRATIDPQRIQQMLVILVDNAIRYAPPNTAVELRLDRRGSHVRIEVRDRGPGIPADLRMRVFRRFSSIDPSRAESGAGLGLAIARSIVSAHRGQIVLGDNHPGLAAIVTLPVHARRGRVMRSKENPMFVP